MSKLVIIIPSLLPTGPVKGAFALANGLSKYYSIHFIVLSRPTYLSLPHDYTYHFLPKALAPFLVTSYIVNNISSKSLLVLSLCFSADLVNLFTPRSCISISSVRGQLLQLYSLENGIIGKFLALFHYFIISRLDAVVCMSRSMSFEYHNLTRKDSFVIGNFIDESLQFPDYSIRPISSSCISVSFIGRLVSLKSPHLLLDAIADLIAYGVSVHLDIIGDGPLYPQLLERCRLLNVDKHVTFHGHLADPWSVAAFSDCFVLPSKCEGISRASLEALYLGIPCILKNVASNPELITPGINGFLFDSPSELPDLILKSMSELPTSAPRKSLLPPQYSQSYCIDAYHSLFMSLLQ